MSVYFFSIYKNGWFPGKRWKVISPSHFDLQYYLLCFSNNTLLIVVDFLTSVFYHVNLTVLTIILFFLLLIGHDSFKRN